MASREVRDAVHGLIGLESREWAVVDTRAFQRLRSVHQLALTHLVYPGARHSRFEHCMGACHIAGRLARRLKETSEYELDPNRVRLAALVHDIGHGPFSHVGEEVFETLTGRNNIHETISAGIVRYDEQIRRAIGDDELSEWIAELLSTTGHGARRSVERDIVAGPADIDKLDYLLRDSHYCGVNYGRYDIDKVIESARALVEIDSELAFNYDGIFALEEMLLARYHMHRQVYGHKTRVGTDRMLVRAMLNGVRDRILPEEVFRPPALDDMDIDWVKRYLQWDDTSVMLKLLEAGEAYPSGQLAAAIVERRLFKRVYRFSFRFLVDELGRQVAGFVQSPDPSVIRDELPDVEEAIAAHLELDAYWVCLHWENFKSPVSMAFNPRVMKQDIMIVFDDDEPVRTFHETSEVFSRTEREAEGFVSLYVRPKAGQDLHDVVGLKDLVLTKLDEIGRASAQV